MLILMLIALAVFISKTCDEGMWLLIALYWAVLTAKNFCDWMNIRNNHLNDDKEENPNEL